MPGRTPDRNIVEFGIGVGEYESVVRVSKGFFQILVPDDPTPERCVKPYHVHRTPLELIAERKFRRRLLTMTQCRDHRSLFAGAGGPTLSQIFFSRVAL